MYYHIYELRDFWECVINNHSDSYFLTALYPRDLSCEKFPAYILFNCYGSFGPYCKNILNVPRKHKKPIVEVSRNEYEGNGNSIPVSVSKRPQILLKGNKLRDAAVQFNANEWEQILSFIAQNRDAILTHWIGGSSSLELLSELRYGGRSIRYED